MSGATTRNVIRGLIAIAAVASIVLPPVTIDVDAQLGTIHNEITLGEAVTAMRTFGEWPALIVGIIGTFIMTESALAFDEQHLRRFRWVFTLGTLMALVFPWRALHAVGASIQQSGLAASGSHHLSLGLIVPIICFLCISGVTWYTSLAHPPVQA